jgi:hypothetical protein
MGDQCPFFLRNFPVAALMMVCCSDSRPVLRNATQHDGKSVQFQSAYRQEQKE